MKRIVLVIAFASLCYFNGIGQTCATPYAQAPAAFTENCLSGPFNYIVNVTATSDSALNFDGLYLEPGPIAADVNCPAHTFTIPRQRMNVNLFIDGHGVLNIPYVYVHYDIYLDSLGTVPNDSCNGYYQAVTMALTPAHQVTCELFPNPSLSITHLKIRGHSFTDESWTYRILDLQGRIVSAGDLDTQMSAVIDTRALARGVYRVVARAADGQFASKALVVE